MKDYTYIIARIRAKETELLGQTDIERMILAEDYEAAKDVLGNKGSQNSESDFWELISEASEESIGKLFKYPIDYHNIKASVKSVYRNIDGNNLLKPYGTLPKESVYESIKARTFSELPEPFSTVSEEALGLLMRTGDGQACDTMIDKAMLDAMADVGKDANDDFVMRYVKLYIDMANIKTAARCEKLKKSEAFIKNALSDGGSLDISLLAECAAQRDGSLASYIGSTVYSECAEFIKKHPSQLEKWCDDKIMELMREAKYDISSIAPLFAYKYAQQTEQQIIKFILFAKKNGFGNDVIRERVRDIYA